MFCLGKSCYGRCNQRSLVWYGQLHFLISTRDNLFSSRNGELNSAKISSACNYGSALKNESCCVNL